MGNRLLKESICISDSIDALSWFEEVLFYRLIVNCDDYGRFDGRSLVIKNRLFPLKDNITVKAVEAAIHKLVSVELVVLYEFEGKLYLHLPTWDKHQQIRAKRSKYPAPEDGLQKHDINCNHMISDAPVIQSNPNPKKESESPPIAPPEGGGTKFDQFWASYPKKVAKEAARKAFSKVKIPVEDLIAAIERQKVSDQWRKENGQFIPNPATWLNQGRWQDELPEQARATKRDDRAAGADQADLEKMLERLRRQ